MTYAMPLTKTEAETTARHIRMAGLDPTEYDLAVVRANAAAFCDDGASPAYAWAKALGQPCPEHCAENRVAVPPFRGGVYIGGRLVQ